MSDTTNTYVEVNGSRIEKRYFVENVDEARKGQWSEKTVSAGEGHVHCLICWMALDPETRAYWSNTGWICDYCHDHFINDNDEPALTLVEKQD
jgi:hypothetical protein